MVTAQIELPLFGLSLDACVVVLVAGVTKLDIGFREEIFLESVWCLELFMCDFNAATPILAKLNLRLQTLQKALCLSHFAASSYSHSQLATGD